MKWSKLTFHLKSSSGGFSEHFSPSFASVSLSFWLLYNLLASLAQLCLSEVTLVCLAALLFISRVTCFEMLRCLFPPPAGSSSELSSSEAAPWLPRCAPTVHAERFIICELTMSPCRVERTEEAESGCAGQSVERETHGRASIEHHCTDDRHQPVLARPSPADTAPPDLAAVPQFGGRASSTAGTGWPVVQTLHGWLLPRCSRFPLQATRSAEPRATAAPTRPDLARSDGQGCNSRSFTGGGS